MKNIYDLMVEAGVEIRNHYSDLYVPVTEETRKIVDSYNCKCSVKVFTSLIDGKRWFDIPLAYAPYWDKRMGNRATVSSQS